MYFFLEFAEEDYDHDLPDRDWYYFGVDRGRIFGVVNTNYFH